ncbi:hypothetical protein Hanom_Chr10g00894421 [Helianthus anomalus]
MAAMHSISLSLSLPFIDHEGWWVMNMHRRSHHIFTNPRHLSKITQTLSLSLEFSRKPPSILHNFENFQVLVRINLNPWCFQVILKIQMCFLGETSFQTSKIMSKPT